MILPGPKKIFKYPIKQTTRPPYIQLQVSTWSKDSHALYDYQAVDNRFYNETFYIKKNCKIYRHVTSMKTYVQYEDDKNELAMQNIYICSLYLDFTKKIYKIQSADVTGVLPHPFLRKDHPDIFRNSFIVIRDFQKDPGNQGFPLQVGNYIKLGRVEYLVIQIKDNFNQKTLKQTSHLELNKQTHVATGLEQGSCKVCLCEEATETDPLINPCNCKGSCKLVHSNCLKNWINSKVKRQVNGITVSYNFSKFQCEICKALFPKIVQLKDGTEVEMITFEKPSKPYIVLESVNSPYERKQEIKERNLHVISSQEKYPVKLGRGHQCQIRITDISVSRVHAEMRFQNGKYYIKDLNSKFGTLIKFRQQFDIKQRMRVQYGRTCFDFKLDDKQKTQEQLYQEELAKRPVFQTRAQRRARGQVDDDDDDY